VTTTESIVIDGYDLFAESGRLSFPDQTVCGRTLNRGTACVPVDGVPQPDQAAVKSEHEAQILPNTLDTDVSPVLDLSCPVSGMFVDSPTGVYMDLYQGVAQKLVDEHHPLFQQTVQTLVDNGLAFRREINTDDFEYFGNPIPGLHTPQELAAMVNRLAAEAYPGKGGYRCFFSNSGAEAGEAGMKLASLHAYRRFLRKYGEQTLARVMSDLGIERDGFYDADESFPDPVYEDYPFFYFACDGAFHGRTMGVLNLTRSKKAQHLGYGKLHWVRHVTFNGQVADFTGQLDDRPITEILDAPGGISGALEAGRVPSDLVAAFVTEVYQGEGGYRLADRGWLQGIAAACSERSILLGTDEVQSFGRTGRLFATEHFGVEPDITWMAKAAVMGITLVRTDLAQDCHVGWHSNTFGSGKLFDVNMAYATFELLTEHRDPLFEGRTYLENSSIKGEYVRMKLGELMARHQDTFTEFSGLGGMWGLTVRHREEIIRLGWQMGLKLLGCGRSGEHARLRILLLADVLTREVDELVAALDRVLGMVEANHPD
jgi:4-aminobutyrate aminotransferase-like enzyme